LELLISNCEPILGEIVSKFDEFNKFNKIGQAFDNQAMTGGGGFNYGDGSSSEEELDTTEIIKRQQGDFSIEKDCQVKKVRT